MSNVPEYITSVYQPFSSFHPVSDSGSSGKVGIIENFSGNGQAWNPKCKGKSNDTNNIPYEQSIGGFVKYTGSVAKDTDTGFYYNERPDWNGGAVLSLDQKMSDYIFDNPYK